MKKFLISLFCVSLLSTALRAEAPSRATIISRLDTCEAILQEVQSNAKTAIPADILHRAKGIIIVNQFQVGFIFGIKDGYAVAMVRRPNGKWSVPAFLQAGELSLGLQAGGRSINAVLVLMDDNTARLLFKNRFNLGAEAKAVAGVRAAETDGYTRSIVLEPNVLVYSSTEGAYLSAAVKTGYMSPHDDANRVLYNTRYRMPELLYSDWVTPPEETHFLMDYVTRLTQ